MPKALVSINTAPVGVGETNLDCQPATIPPQKTLPTARGEESEMKRSEKNEFGTVIVRRLVPPPPPHTFSAQMRS